jgi:hypothetical protein
MKKILLSVATILAISAVTVGATRAYFTSSVSVPNITLATGTLHITDKSKDWMMPVTFTNLAPGSLVRKWVVIANDGSLDISSVTVSVTDLNDPSNILGQTRGWTNSAVRVGDSDTVNQVQVGYSDNALALLNNAPLLWTGHPVLHPGEWLTAQIQFIIPNNWGNEMQGKSASFNLMFHAEQMPSAF